MGKNTMWGSPDASNSHLIERQRSPPQPCVPQAIRPATLERTAFGNITNTYLNQNLSASFQSIPKNQSMGGHAFVSSNSFKQLMIQPDMLNEYESPSNLLKYCSKLSANKFNSEVKVCGVGAVDEAEQEMNNRVQVSPFFAKNSEL